MTEGNTSAKDSTAGLTDFESVLAENGVSTVPLAYPEGGDVSALEERIEVNGTHQHAA